MKFSVTEKARKRIAQLISREEHLELKLRVAIGTGGCSGLIYIYKLTNVVDARDTILLKGEIEVVLDPTAKTFLQGAALDYVEGFGKAHFQINNPNAVSRCGCGRSFSV